MRPRCVVTVRSTNAELMGDLPRRQALGCHLQAPAARAESAGTRCAASDRSRRRWSPPSRPGRRPGRPRPERPGGSPRGTRRDRRPCPGTHRPPGAASRDGRHRPPPPRPGSWPGVALSEVPISHSESRSPGRPSPTSTTSRERRIRLTAARHSSAVPASARTCMSGRSPISLATPARTTASGSTTTTPRRSNLLPAPPLRWSRGLGHPCLARTRSVSSAHRVWSSRARERCPGWELPAPSQPPSAPPTTPHASARSPAVPTAGPIRTEAFAGMPPAGEESAADTEASHEPTATRTAKTTPDAAPTAMASPLIRALPGGVSASQDHRHRGHQEEQQVARWRLRRTRPGRPACRRSGPRGSPIPSSGPSSSRGRSRRRLLRTDRRSHPSPGPAPTSTGSAAATRGARCSWSSGRRVARRSSEVGPGRAGRIAASTRSPANDSTRPRTNIRSPPAMTRPPGVPTDRARSTRGGPSAARPRPRRGRDQQGEHEPREVRRWHLEAPRHQPVPRDGDVDAQERGQHE